ncbi:hypothetical protein WDU94_003835, partial [Cyamophila willieti]
DIDCKILTRRSRDIRSKPVITWIYLYVHIWHFESCKVKEFFLHSGTTHPIKMKFCRVYMCMMRKIIV